MNRLETRTDEILGKVPTGIFTVEVTYPPNPEGEEDEQRSFSFISSGIEADGTGDFGTEVSFRANVQVGAVIPPDQSVRVASNERTATITDSHGARYLMRPVQPRDGVWISSLGIPLPVDTIEYLYGVMDMDAAVEDLWVALDAETEEFYGLIYSSQAGVYLRSSGGWHVYPQDDESLDGYESIDVNGDFLAFYDELESAGEQPTREQVLDYAQED